MRRDSWFGTAIFVFAVLFIVLGTIFIPWPDFQHKPEVSRIRQSASVLELSLTIKYDNPYEVGADRLVNGVAGFYKYGGPCVVVDLGTTINFDVISRDAEYLGGAIAVGIGISGQALFNRTARLPLVDFRQPKDVIGTNTVASIRSGLYYGTIGMIDGILEHVIERMGPDTKAVATGGQAPLIVAGSRFVKTLDEHLTLEGLQMIWERNRSTPGAP